MRTNRYVFRDLTCAPRGVYLGARSDRGASGISRKPRQIDRSGALQGRFRIGGLRVARSSHAGDPELCCQIGSLLFQEKIKVDGSSSTLLTPAIEALQNKQLAPANRFSLAASEEIRHLFNEFPLRRLVTKSENYPIRADRDRALVGAWYEMFPRSEGATQTSSGTFITATNRLPDIAAMGFDVLYLPPIHPIGETFRKGANNSLNAAKSDPGVPWAIGSKDGGHDAINPALGSMPDFEKFVSEANHLGLEIALDFALQVSPDHPWVKAHPNWFYHRPDGTIAYAENPPKKYQDIYPINFDQDLAPSRLMPPW